MDVNTPPFNRTGVLMKTPKSFYVVRKCKAFHAPVIFLTQEDHDWFIGQEKEGAAIETQAFDSLLDASQYIVDVNSSAGARQLSTVAKLISRTEANLNDNCKTTNTVTCSSSWPHDCVEVDGAPETKLESSSVMINENAIDRQVDAITTSTKNKKRKKDNTTSSKSQKRCRNDAGDRHWQEHYVELCSYYKANGNCNVRVNENRKLYLWILKMRDEYRKVKNGKKNSLTTQQLALLTELGFSFLTGNKIKSKKKKTFWMDEWDTMIDLLAKYKDKFGTADVPNTGSDQEGFSGLGQWVGTVRQHVRTYKENPAAVTFLNEDKIQDLLGVGFCVDPTRGKKRYLVDRIAAPITAAGLRHEDKGWLNCWNDRISMLSRYKEKYNTVNLPETNNDFEGFEDLKRWLTTTCYYIRQYNADPTRCPGLTQEMVDQILDMGLSLYAKKEKYNRLSLDASWDIMFAKLAQFHNENGHVKVPTSNKSLNAWCVQIRKEYDKLMNGAKSVLTAQRVVRMVELGFRFDRVKRLTFDERFLQWKSYRDVHGKDPGKGNVEGLGKF